MSKLWTYGLICIFFAACGGGGTVSTDVIDMGEYDVQEVGEVAGSEVEAEGWSPEISEDAEVLVEVETTEQPSITFYFVVASGTKGEGETQVSLTKDDEPLAYADTPGFQVDIVASTKGVEEGKDVTLTIAGNIVATSKVTIEGTNGVATFSAVTLTHSKTGYEVKVSLVASNGTTVFEAKTVSVDIGTCGVDILPKNNACILSDSKPLVDGVQFAFTVTNPDRTCDTARVTYVVDGVQKSSDPVVLGPTGSATIEVTLFEAGVIPDGVPVIVNAEVSDSKAPERTATTASFTYIVDLVDPVVTITKPDNKSILSLVNDKDGDPSNGLNIDVTGTSQGVSDTVSLTINDNLFGSTTPAEDGSFVFQDISLTNDGKYVFRASGADACGRIGYGEAEILARVSKAKYAFISPAPGATLWAKDDKDPIDPYVYQTNMLVLAEDESEGVTLSIRCRKDTFGSPSVLVGQEKIETLSGDHLYEIPVALDVLLLSNKVKCQVLDDAANPSKSDEVPFTVALPPPGLMILSPKANAFVTKAELALILFASGLDGVKPSVRILDNNNAILIDFEPPTPIMAGGGSWKIPLTIGGVPLPDGIYTLLVDAKDQFGNLASDIAQNVTSVQFTLDTTPPVVAIVGPDHDMLDPVANPLDADQDPIAPGYQTTISIKVLMGGGEGTLVCMRVIGGSEGCKTLGAGDDTADFHDITLQPGENIIEAWAIDAAKNKGEIVARTFTLEIDALRVEITSPAKDGPVAIVPFDMTVRVLDRNLAPAQGAEVTLHQNGVAIETKVSDDLGYVTFQVLDLSTTGDTFLATASLGDLSGASLPRKLYLKTSKPELTFKVPKDGDKVNLKYVACNPGNTDCELDVVLDTVNIEDSAAGSLVVNCGSGDQSWSGFVYDSELVFQWVVLPDQKTCTLRASASDMLGQSTEAGPISVVVDRIAPAFKGFNKPHPSVNALTKVYDESDTLEGIQFTFRIYVSGLEAQASATLSYGLLGGSIETVGVKIPTNISDQSVGEVVFPQVTLPDGTVKIVVTLMDLVGNVTEVSRLIDVWSKQPVVRIGSPAFVDNTACDSSNECSNNGVCVQGRCWFPWGIFSNRSVRVALSEIPPHVDNLRICTDTPGVGAAPCSTIGFRTVSLTTGLVDGTFMDVPVTLPDGPHHLIAEAMLAPDVPWVSSLGNPQANERERYIYQDSVPPVVTAIWSPSDINGDNFLSALESSGNRIFKVRVEASEGGRADLYLSPNIVASNKTFEGSWDVDVELLEGVNVIYALIRDIVGNTSSMPPNPDVLYYTPIVDTVPPTIYFVKPVTNIVKAGDSTDIVVLSDAVSREVSLYEKLGGTYVKKDAALVGPDGLATFPSYLTEGNHELRVEVSDQAGNIASVETSVFVDTVPPQMALISPSPSGTTVLSDADDAKPGQPGFQVEVSFGAISPDSWRFEVMLASNCDESFVLCDPPVLIASGPITNIGGLEPSLFPTIFGTDTPYYMFIVKVFDAVGNETSKVARVVLDLSSCQVLITGIVPGGYINNQACPIPGTDCANALVPITVSFTLACGEVDRVGLFIGGSSMQTSPTGQQASFDANFNHGTTPVVEAKVFIGAYQIGTSGAFSVIVDLVDPVVAFTTPPAGSSNVWGRSADNNGSLDGLQITLHATWSDSNLAQGKVVSLTYDRGTGPQALIPENVVLPMPLFSSSGGSDFMVTLPDQSSGNIAITVQDAAGNEASSMFTTRVDLIPPAAIALEAVMVSPRLPAITLTWTAVGDNGTEANTKAAAYDIRYSTLPITTESEFQNACRVTELAYTPPIPTPAVAGSIETFTISGPDIRDPAGQPCKLVSGTSGLAGYHFAIRAVDAAGNAGAIGTASDVGVDLGFRFARIFPGTSSPWNNTVFQRRVFRIGDINGDGKGDLALGGAGANAYCIVYGHRASMSDPTIPDLTLSAGAGTNHLCIAGATGKRLGTSPTYLGDVNGDGIDDLGVGDGASGAQTFYIHFGVLNGKISTTPNITITGMQPGILGVIAAGGGDFNKDGVRDILIGSRAENKAYLIPGNSSWNAATNITLNLQSEVDRNAFNVITFTMVKDPPTNSLTQFGANVSFVKDVNGDGYDEAAVSVNGTTGNDVPDPTQVVVFTGRPIVAAATITVSQLNWSTYQQPDDATAARLFCDSYTTPQFGANTLYGLDDLDGDGRGDIVVSHSPNLWADPSIAKSVYVFYGSAVAANIGVGKAVTIKAPLTAPQNSAFRNEKGVVVYGPFDYPAIIGDLDAEGGTASGDLAYAMYSTTSAYGKVYVRLNIADPAGSFSHGWFPWASPTLVDPLEPLGQRFGYLGAVKIGDFNGDGYDDLLIGTNGSGYAMIFY